MLSDRQLARFWDRADKSGGPSACWIWLGSRTGGKGKAPYGVIRDASSKSFAAHRVAFELLNGPIPVDLTIDHLCRTPPCVNPAHMEPVSRAENTRRAPLVQAAAAKTHCMRGHAFTPENTYICGKGWRHCKLCQNATVRQYRAKQAAARRRP